MSAALCVVPARRTARPPVRVRRRGRQVSQTRQRRSGRAQKKVRPCRQMLAACGYALALSAARELSRDMFFRGLAEGAASMRQRGAGFRRLALHLASEAFDLRPYELARVAKVDRTAVGQGHRLWWERREVCPQTEMILAGMIDFLKEKGDLHG